MKRLRRYVDDVSAWWAGYYTAGIRHIGMSGPDGSASFSKTFSILVLVSYYTNTNLPPSVAITLIISSHGTKLLLAAIKNGVFGVRASGMFQRSERLPAAQVAPSAFGGDSNE